MPETDTGILAALIFAAAVLYTSVGHAGASGYVAAMALMGVAPAVMKPTALTLNIFVASIASARWTKNGRDLPWKSLLPLIAGSIPAAFIGGMVQLSATQYRMLVGIALLAAGLKFVFQPKMESEEATQVAAVPNVPGFVTGAGVGLLSGLTGTGGGIFLTPLLVLFGWTGARRASGLTAPFILLNSVAALAGNYASLQKLPAELPYFIAAALAGALVGTQIGTRWTTIASLQRLLGIVLLIAAGKFLLT